MNLWRKTLGFNRVNLLPLRCFSTNKRNYYDVLGISKTASQQEIKEAFYTLSKKYHPDVIGSDSKRFIEVKEAYDVLKDEDKRRIYDAGFDTTNFEQFVQQQRQYSDFSRGTFRTGRRTHEYRYNHHHYNQEEIDRIWKQFQEQIRNRVNAQYDAEMRQKAQERQYDEFIKKRTYYQWQRYADNFNRQNDSSQNIEYKRGWTLLNKILLTYFAIFFTVAVLRSIFGPLRVPEEKVVITPTRPEDSGYNYGQQRERFRQMMETPPFGEKPAQPDPNYPYGLPTLEPKE